MHRSAYAMLQTTLGRGATRQFPVRQLTSFQTETALDRDVDSFSLTLGDPHAEFMYLTDRDVETRATIYLAGPSGKARPIFTGIVDDISFNTGDFVHSLSGRDMSALAVDSDVAPGKWKHVRPREFIRDRAHAIGLTNTTIHGMREIGTLISNGGETEWELWYRIARMRDMFIWTGPLGQLHVTQLNHSDKASYFFGQAAKGDTRGVWDMPEVVSVHTSKQRKAEVWVFGEDQKTGTPFYAKSRDPTIKNWLRKPLSIITSSTAKSNIEAREDADEEVYESIVGAYQIELGVHDHGQVYAQNQMARLHLPPPLMHLNGLYFVVGVSRIGGPDGFTQIVRLREKGFAVSKRVPDPPKINQPNEPADRQVPSSMQAILSQATLPDGRPLPWADAFQQAATEWGSDKGWDYATFLAVLLAICEHESNFTNVRGTTEGAINHVIWKSFDQFKQNTGDWRDNPIGVQAETPEGAHAGPIKPSGVDVRHKYSLTFSNNKENPDSPRYPDSDTAVGPMQLVSRGYKQWADEYGWNGAAKHDELEGGRWNPRSNIRAAARALADKLDNPPAANPNDPKTIRIGIERYYGSRDPDANAKYANAVMGLVDQRWLSVAQTVVSASQTLPVGTQTKTTIDGVTYEAPANTPDVIKKAINFALRRRGDPYEWGGTGPYYDCSSFVTAAYAAASADLRAKLDEPVSGKSHGETTFTLYEKGRFPAPAKDALLIGDLVFFDHGDNLPQHVGLYMGDGRMVHDPSTGDVVKVSSINNGYYDSHYIGARRLVDWKDAVVTRDPAGTTAGRANPNPGDDFPTVGNYLMIQAGHDKGTHDDQPYGHETQSGAVGEAEFTVQVRDRVLALFDAMPGFYPAKGTSWDASAGATAAAADDIDYNGSLFVSIHYDRGTAGSGFFFGYTRGATDGRPQAMSTESAKLADAIAAEILKIEGAPSRLTDNTGFGGTPAGATGWGYYAWGSDLRAAPDNVNHVPNAKAAVILECGRSSDGTYLDTKRNELGKAIYRGICAYWGVKPTS